MEIDSRKYLNSDVTVNIDRPLGSKHPAYGFTYMLNYGYIPNTLGKDGEELDAYILGVFESVSKFTGHVIAVIERINDNDDKLIVVPVGKNYSNEQIRALTEFQERFFESIIIR